MEKVGWPLCQEDVAHQLPLAHLGHDAKSLRDATEPALFLEKPLGEGMVGKDEALARRQVVLLFDPIEHFARGLFREGQQQDLFGRHAVLAKPPVALDQYPGLSGARSGDDQQRPLGMRDRGPLRVRERRGGRDQRSDFPPPLVARVVAPDCRKRISRTAVAPMRSLSCSINMPRSKWS